MPTQKKENKQMNLIEKLKPELEKLIVQSRNSLNEAKRVALGEAWGILQLTVASVIQSIENIAKDIAGKDKKAAAMLALSQFYDSVFIIIDIPFVPSVLEPIIHKSVKGLMMVLVSATIDSMVATFKKVGVFQSKQ